MQADVSVWVLAVGSGERTGLSLSVHPNIEGAYAALRDNYSDGENEEAPDDELVDFLEHEQNLEIRLEEF